MEKWKPEIPFFLHLEDRNFSDIQRKWEEANTTSKQTTFTWRNKNSSSHIDYIWTSQNLTLNNIYSFNNTEFNHITNSNHTLLQVKLIKNGLTNSAKQASINRRETKTISNLKAMDKEKWITFA